MLMLLRITDFDTKIGKIEKKVLIYDHDKNNLITTQEFNKLTADCFAARLAQAHLATKADIADLVKKKDFDKNLKNINKKVTSKKTKHVEAEKKVTDLTKNVAQISEKGYGFLLDRKFFIGDNGYHNFLAFAPIKTG